MRKVRETRWKLTIALHHFLEVAGAFAGQQGGGVHDREAALGFEGGGEGFAGLDARSDVVELGGEVRVALVLPSISQRAEDGQAGADQGQELLVEDEERLQLGLSATTAEAAAGLHREDVVAGVREALPQFIRGSGRMQLLLHSASLIRQLDDELCHVFPGSLPKA